MLVTPDPAFPDQWMRSLISNKNIPQTDSKLLSCCSLLMFVLIKSSLTSCPDGLHVLRVMMEVRAGLVLKDRFTFLHVRPSTTLTGQFSSCGQTAVTHLLLKSDRY